MIRIPSYQGLRGLLRIFFLGIILLGLHSVNIVTTRHNLCKHSFALAAPMFVLDLTGFHIHHTSYIIHLTSYIIPLTSYIIHLPLSRRGLGGGSLHPQFPHSVLSDHRLRAGNGVTRSEVQVIIECQRRVGSCNRLIDRDTRQVPMLANQQFCVLLHSQLSPSQLRGIQLATLSRQIHVALPVTYRQFGYGRNKRVLFRRQIRSIVTLTTHQATATHHQA